VWFHGDVGAARQRFMESGGIAVEHFDPQITAINEAESSTKSYRSRCMWTRSPQHGS
jgi:hypothetical protein